MILWLCGPAPAPAACNHITDEGVARLALLPRLELLDLGGCHRITGRTLGGFAAHGSLQTLLLGNCSSLTDSGLAAASTVASIRIMDISGCNRLTDAGAVTLGSLRRLARLTLRSDSKCSDRCGLSPRGLVWRPTVARQSGVPACQPQRGTLCNLRSAVVRMLYFR